MSNLKGITLRQSRLGRNLLTLGCAAALLSVAGIVYGQQPFTMAPPIQANGGPGDATPDAAASTVFNWQEIPANQNVPIQRAVFDKGGYQLYDTVGETIVIPFTNNNLYVMQFALSDDGSMYFVNNGSEPILYLPQDGYLENASDPGGHWYPFTQNWHPTTPVFIGPAPSWNDYVAMGWYPNMAYYGGYWCSRPFVSIGVVTPISGLFFQIGGAQYVGWDAFAGYYHANPAPYQMVIVNRNIYHYGGRNWQQYAGANHPFNGAGHPFIYGQGFSANTGRTFMGTGHPYSVGHGTSGSAPAPSGFHGSGSSGGSWQRSTTSTPSHGFQGAAGSHPSQPQSSPAPAPSHTFRGAPGGSPAYGGSHGAPGGSPAPGSSHGAPSQSQGHTFQGGQPNQNNHSQQYNH